MAAADADSGRALAHALAVLAGRVPAEVEVERGEPPQHEQGDGTTAMEVAQVFMMACVKHTFSDAVVRHHRHRPAFKKARAIFACCRTVARFV
jgi:hypothetical protein